MNTEKEVQNEFESRGDRLHRSFTSWKIAPLFPS